MLRFLVFTDLHYDDVDDGDKRIRELLDKARNEKVDFIVSLGDLCYPIKENQHILEALNLSEIPIYHTIGNHDTQGYDIEDTLKFLAYDKSYYAFTCGDYKFIVLDCCYWQDESGEYHFPNKKKVPANYPIIPIEEVSWLKEELADNKKYIIFSHQSLVNEFGNRGIRNRQEILDLFNGKEVILCINGHDHGSDLKLINDTIFYTVNSTSHYCWWGGNPPGVEILPYKDALHVIVELDENEVRIKGMSSEYKEKTPIDVGVPDYRWNGVSILPECMSYI